MDDDSAKRGIKAAEPYMGSIMQKSKRGINSLRCQPLLNPPGEDSADNLFSQYSILAL